MVGGHDALAVMAGQEEVDGWEGGGCSKFADSSLQCALGNGVVGGVSVGFGIVDEGSFIRGHVRAPHKLKTQGEPFLLGSGQVLGQRVGCTLQVGLVGIVDHGVSISVVLAHEVERQAEDTPLEVLGFGVDEDPYVALFASLTNFIHGVDHLRRGKIALGKSLGDRRTSPGQSVKFETSSVEDQKRNDTNVNNLLDSQVISIFKLLYRLQSSLPPRFDIGTVNQTRI